MGYTPRPAPASGKIDDLRFYLEEELTAIARAFNDVEGVFFTVLHVEPKKPRQGLVVYADGTNWNPGGGGRGLYVRLVNSWAKCN